MATSIITGVVTDPAGTPLENIGVKCRLLPRPAYLTATGAELSLTVETTSDSNGQYQFTLTETADITPADSFYEITEYIPPRYGGAVKHIIQVGANAASVLASLVSSPPSPEQNVYLTQAAGDARYVLGPASFGGAGDVTTIEPDDTADAGSVDAFSRIDHRHAIDADTPGDITIYDTAAEGTSTSFARADHQHGFPELLAVTDGLIITGSPASYTDGNLLIGPVGDGDQGGRIKLKGGTNGAGTDHTDWEIDVHTDQFRVFISGSVKFQFDISTNLFSTTGGIQSAGDFYLSGQTTYRLTLGSSQGGLPWASNAPTLVGESGWAFYHAGLGAYRMGWRGSASPYSTNYLWANGAVLFGSAPDDGAVTATVNVIGSLRATTTLSAGTSVNSLYSIPTAVGDNEWSNNAIIINPGTTQACMSFHPGGVAPQIRVGQSNNTVFFRNSNNGAYVTVAAVISDQSSETTKQDIADWPPRPQDDKPLAPGQARKRKEALDKVAKVKPKFFRRDHDAWMWQVRHVKEGDGLVDGPHICGQDCEYTLEERCPRYRDWELGSVGVLAEDLYETFPEAVMLDNDGKPMGVSPTALAVAALAAIQELRAEVEALHDNRP